MANGTKYDIEDAPETKAAPGKYDIEDAPEGGAPAADAGPAMPKMPRVLPEGLQYTTRDLPGASPKLLEKINTGEIPYVAPKGSTEKLNKATDPTERQYREFNLGAMSSASGLPETMTPVRSALRSVVPNIQQGTLQAIGEDKQPPEPLPVPFKGLVSPEGRTPEEREEARAHAIGETAGTVVPNAIEELTPAPGRVAGAVKTGLGKIGEPFALGMTPEQLLTKGVGPKSSALGWNDAISRPGVQRALQGIESQFPKEQPMSVRDLHEAIPEAQEKIWDEQVEPALQRQAGRPVEMKPAAAAVRKVITPEMQEFDPAQAEQLASLADKLERSRTVTEANSLLKFINGKLESYFAKYPSARKAAMNNPETAGWESARRAIREQFLNTMQDPAVGETGIRDAKLDWGALETVGKEVERRVNQAERLKPMGLHRMLGLVSGGGAALAGFLGGHAIGGPVGGIGMAVLGELAQRANEPGNLIRKGIRSFEPGPAPPPAAGTPFVPIEQYERAAGPYPQDYPAPIGPNLPAGWEPGRPWTGGAPRPTPGFAITDFPARGSMFGETQVGPPPEMTWGGRLEPIPTAQPGGATIKPIGTAPPPVPEQFRMERIGQQQPSPESSTILAGGGGLRIPPGSRELPPPSWRTQGAPPEPIPAARPKPAGPPAVSIESLVKPRPQFAPVAEDFSPQQLEEARLMIQSELDMMKSGERPGRQFIETEFNPQREQRADKGVFAGGHWLGIKSMRTMLPFFRNIELAPSVVEQALKRGEGPTFQRVMRTAAEMIEREKAGEAGERSAIQGPEDSGEVSFLPEGEQLERIGGEGQQAGEIPEARTNPAGGPIRYETDPHHPELQWAISPEGYRVTLPKGIAEADREAYAQEKLAEQARIHRNLGK